MSIKAPGYVYLLTNPCFREDWVKIGKSSRPVDVRSKGLDNTAVPIPFEISSAHSCPKTKETLLGLIKAPSISHIMGKYWRI